jgi:hypothetical protein
MMQQPSSTMRRRKRLTADELLFQPWFLSSEIAQAIRILIPPGYERTMRDYFDAYGCMRCNREDAVYQSNGMCKSCANVIRIRLRQCIRRRLEGPREIVPARVFVGIPNRASRLLQGISRGVPQSRGLETAAVRLTLHSTPTRRSLTCLKRSAACGPNVRVQCGSR